MADTPDIVARLRALSAFGQWASTDLAVEAADEIERLRSDNLRLRERLELTHVWTWSEAEGERRVEVPLLLQDSLQDGIECRDATIRGQDERLARMEVEIERLRGAIWHALAELEQTEACDSAASSILADALERAESALDGERRG